MYRSSSWNRASDEYNNSLISLPLSSSFDGRHQKIQIYDENIAAMAKKERARVKFAENAVHLIPLVLVLCALVLWLFSFTPGTSKGESRIEGLGIEGDISIGDRSYSDR